MQEVKKNWVTDETATRFSLSTVYYIYSQEWENWDTELKLAILSGWLTSNLKKKAGEEACDNESQLASMSKQWSHIGWQLQMSA